MLKDQDTPSGGFTAKEVDGVGDKKLGHATTIVVATCIPFLEDFQTSEHLPQLAKVLRLLEYQLLD